MPSSSRPLVWRCRSRCSKAFDWPAVRTRATVDGVVTVVDALALSEGRVTHR